MGVVIAFRVELELIDDVAERLIAGRPRLAEGSGGDGPGVAVGGTFLQGALARRTEFEVAVEVGLLGGGEVFGEQGAPAVLRRTGVADHGKIPSLFRRDRREGGLWS